MRHKVYEAIVTAIRSGKLLKPFTKHGFEMSRPGFGYGTYNSFLYKHIKGSNKADPELFENIAPGQFQCLRPFKYGL